MSIRSSRALRARRLVACAALLMLGLASPARADDPVTRRLMVFTGGGFGGTASIAYDGAASFSFSGDLAPSPIAGARAEVAFMHYLAFGGQVSTSFWRGVDQSRRNPMIDFSITPRVRVPFVIDGRFLLEPYVVLPVGFSLSVFNSSIDLGGDLDRVNPGINVGALLGVTLLTRRHVGAFVEFGWMHHVAYDTDRSGARWTLTMNQATLNAGVVYAF